MQEGDIHGGQVIDPDLRFKGLGGGGILLDMEDGLPAEVGAEEAMGDRVGGDHGVVGAGPCVVLQGDQGYVLRDLTVEVAALSVELQGLGKVGADDGTDRVTGDLIKKVRAGLVEHKLPPEGKLMVEEALPVSLEETGRPGAAGKDAGDVRMAPVDKGLYRLIADAAVVDVLGAGLRGVEDKEWNVRLLQLLGTGGGSLGGLFP